MPDARTHDVITVVSGLAMAPAAYSFNLALGYGAEDALRHSALFVGAHMLSGIMFSPDLDLDSAIDDRWGIFYWIWRPYMWLVPHRSRWLSHGLLVPPLLRLLYFYWVVIGLLVGGAWALGRIGIAVPDLHSRVSDVVFGLIARHPREAWAWVLGFITGGAAHTIADWLVTGGKRYLRAVGIQVRFNDANHDRWRPRRRRAWL